MGCDNWVPSAVAADQQARLDALLLEAIAALACPARIQDSAGDLQVIRASGGVFVLVDQAAAQDGFRRMCCVPTPVTVARGASCSPSGTRWAMPWCGRAIVVMRLLVG
jgi:hypothetical protein